LIGSCTLAPTIAEVLCLAAHWTTRRVALYSSPLAREGAGGIFAPKMTYSFRVEDGAECQGGHMWTFVPFHPAGLTLPVAAILSTRHRNHRSSKARSSQYWVSFGDGTKPRIDVAASF
jgi:hypothetical protein